MQPTAKPVMHPSIRPVTMHVNGASLTRVIAPRTHLADFLRDDCRLTGTHIGCEHGVCGACTVLIDGRPSRSCITFAVACEGSTVTTVEGYDDDPVMLRLRKAFSAHHALQCGYCTPGMLATARDIVLRLPEADEARIRLELAGNLCRCTGYMGIVAAIRSVLADCRTHPEPAIDALRAGTMGLRGPAPGATPSVNVSAAASAPAYDSIRLAEPRIGGVDPAAAGSTFPSAPAGQTPPDASLGAGSTTISGHFLVDAPPSRVWQFMTDLPAVAACLPGASLTGQQGDRLEGRIAIKFGPIRANFVGHASLQRDDDRLQATLRGQGLDSLSQSQTRGDVIYRLSALADDRTRVDVDLQYVLQGPLAQFSRSGLVRDFVGRLIVEFGANVSRALRTGGAAGDVSAQPVTPAKLNAGGLLWSVLVARLRRWLGGRD